MEEEEEEEEESVADDLLFNCWDDGDVDPDPDYYCQYDNEEEEEDDFHNTTTSTNTVPEGGDGDYETEISNRDRGKLSIGVAGAKLVVEEEEDSFASDFYRSGSDWSCLLQIDNNEGGEDKRKKNNKRLKQTNLFQMWGFQKMNPFPPKSNVKFNAAAAGGASLPLTRNNKRKSSNYYYDDDVGGGGGIGGKSSSIANQEQQQRPRLCPFYKKIPGTPFTVDAFRYGNVQGCSAYFLSHFHADHYGGLSKRWSHGPIYCTPITARLTRMLLSVNPSLIHPLELGTEIVIEGIKVTMLEANHCPGAALIHFRLPNGQCYLHTGDFRASKMMQSYPLLINQRINVLYLDTTYCNPKYRFPSKEDVLNFVVRVTKNCMKKQPNTLVIVGAYSIGKECVYLAISKALGVKVYANSSRRRILQSFGWPEISENLCMHGKDTPLHVLPISSLKFETLEHYLKTYTSQYTSILAFRPTGWTYSERIGSKLDLIKPSSKGRVTIYGVPYSEHSSFTELREFVQFLRPEKIIPTVNVGNAANRDKMQSYFREWMKGR